MPHGVDEKKKKMGKGSEQTFFERRYTDGEQAHENMLNITNYQGNAKQKHNETSLRTCQSGYHKKTTNNKCQ